MEHMHFHTHIHTLLCMHVHVYMYMQIPTASFWCNNTNMYIIKAAIIHVYTMYTRLL